MNRTRVFFHFHQFYCPGRISHLLHPSHATAYLKRTRSKYWHNYLLTFFATTFFTAYHYWTKNKLKDSFKMKIKWSENGDAYLLYQFLLKVSPKLFCILFTARKWNKRHTRKNYNVIISDDRHFLVDQKLKRSFYALRLN